MKKSTITRCKRMSMLCFLIFLICAIINIVVSIYTVVNTPGTSFPWYSPIILVGLHYILPIALFFVIYLVFRNKEKKMIDEK